MHITTRRMLGGIALAATFGLGAMTGALADQPRMQSALNHLQMAKDDLQKASSDKGGHRVQAIEAVNNAIRHTRMGMRLRPAELARGRARRRLRMRARDKVRRASQGGPGASLAGLGPAP